MEILSGQWLMDIREFDDNMVMRESRIDALIFFFIP